MHFTQTRLRSFTLFFCLCSLSNYSYALLLETGVGGGIQYTSNARLTSADEVEDTIATTYVGLGLTEDVGPLTYGADAVFRRENYLNDTFADRSYLNLGLNSRWEMIRERFDWFLSNRFTQRPIVSTASQTPDNTQDSNFFNFGADIIFPISGRQTINITPAYSRYYYEENNTDNQQYSLAANWNYQFDRLLNMGIRSSVRQIDYLEDALVDTTFINAAFVISGKPVRSTYTINLGATNVSRDTGQEETGFAGSFNYLKELSSRSTVEFLLSTDLTDTSTISQTDAPGNPDDVQQTSDVVRNRIVQLTYFREDALLKTRISTDYREIIYSDNVALNRTVNNFNVDLGFPVTQLISGGVFLKFENINLPESLTGDRNDKRFNFGALANVTFTQKLSANARVQYRTKESTDSVRNYDEFSVFVGLSYGFGGVRERSSPGGR